MILEKGLVVGDGTVVIISVGNVVRPLCAHAHNMVCNSLMTLSTHK